MKFLKIGIPILIFLFAVWYRSRSKKSKEDSTENREDTENYGSEGMAIGMAIGVSIGSVLDDLAIGMSLGMLVGLAIGQSIKK